MLYLVKLEPGSCICSYYDLYSCITKISKNSSEAPNFIWKLSKIDASHSQGNNHWFFAIYNTITSTLYQEQTYMSISFPSASQNIH